jgi:Spy/CpxP family protein refolding chaperone
MVTGESPRRTRLLGSALLVLTFVVGSLAGAVTNRAFSTRTMTVEQRGSNSPSENGLTTRRQPSVFFSPGVFDSLGATPQQRQAIEAILDRRDREANALFEQIKPSLMAMRKQTWGEMRAQLTPEQLTKLEQIIQERRERWHKERQQHNQDANKPRP